MMFKHPGLLWLLTILIPLIAWYIWKQHNANATMGLSTIRAFAKLPASPKIWLIHFGYFLRLCAIAAVIIALARPQSFNSLSSSTVEGTDIALALDISGSMTATDITPTRFNAAKNVAADFINSRPNDNMALVAFSGESLSLMPLTNDRASLVNALQSVQMGLLTDGTAIGDGLTSAINRLASGKAKSKSVILLTDGTNNAGDVAPSTAAQIAKQMGIRVYTIGIGTNGSIQIADPYGFTTTTLETKIDEASLKSIAQATGGKYFRATNKRMLEDVFDEIDKLEKSRLDVSHYNRTEENFMLWVWIALGCFCLELLMRYTVLRRIP